MAPKSGNIVCIACSIFRSSIEPILKREHLDFPVHYLGSYLHLHPEKLGRSLDRLLKKELNRGHKVLLLYGDCHPHMREQESAPGVFRVRGANCFEILLGRDAYKSLSRQKSFFFLPEWIVQWPEILQKKLGFSGESAGAFMREMHTKLVYLDLGRVPIPIKQLQTISHHCGLPWIVLKVPSDHFLSALYQAMERIHHHG